MLKAPGAHPEPYDATLHPRLNLYELRDLLNLDRVLSSCLFFLYLSRPGEYKVWVGSGWRP